MVIIPVSRLYAAGRLLCRENGPPRRPRRSPRRPINNPSNAELKGERTRHLQPMNWDPSVKSITAFPVIVTMLNKNLDWTDSLGVAFTHQQSDSWRKSSSCATRRRQRETWHRMTRSCVGREDGPNIVIALANPNVVYAPYYTRPWSMVRGRGLSIPPVYSGLIFLVSRARETKKTHQVIGSSRVLQVEVWQLHLSRPGPMATSPTPQPYTADRPENSTTTVDATEKGGDTDLDHSRSGIP